MADEANIIRRVLQGDTESFRLLIERYEKPVVSMIRNLTRDGQACEDLAQEVFLTAYSKLRGFDPARSQFSTWLLTIARNKSINALKKKRPQSLGGLPEQIDEGGPYVQATDREAFARLDEALASLPAAQQRAFALVELEELSYEETAQIEAARVGTIKSRVNRAKAKLAAVLKRLEEDDQ